MEKSDSEIYERAAKLIEEHGHVKGRYGAPEEGGFCLFGAVQWALQEVGAQRRCSGLSMRLADTVWVRWSMPGIEWNDQPERTGPEVVAFLREFADAP